MTNKINPDLLVAWTRQSVDQCNECHPTKDGMVIVCGWHENLTAAAQIIADLREQLDGDL